VEWRAVRADRSASVGRESAPRVVVRDAARPSVDVTVVDVGRAAAVKRTHATSVVWKDAVRNNWIPGPQFSESNCAYTWHVELLRFTRTVLGVGVELFDLTLRVPCAHLLAYYCRVKTLAL